MLDQQNLQKYTRRSCVGFIVCIWILAPYLLLQQFSLYSVFWLEESSIDKHVPVNLNAVYIYFSYYFLLIIAGYATSDKIFVRFLKAVSMVALVSHLCFFFFPTGLSRDSIDIQNAPALYEWLVKWEKPRNCLPSLHASLSILCSLALFQRNKLLGILAAFWTLAILWSALALRQHITIDLAAGVLLASTVWLYVSVWDKDGNT